jgi:hypothetical protein
MKSKILWFLSGLGVGLTMLSLGQAAIPKKVVKTSKQALVKKLPAKKPMTAPVAAAPRAPRVLAVSPLSEIKKGSKVTSPEIETDYSNLSKSESQYAENWNQQQRLRAATVRGKQAVRQ